MVPIDPWLSLNRNNWAPKSGDWKHENYIILAVLFSINFRWMCIKFDVESALSLFRDLDLTIDIEQIKCVIRVILSFAMAFPLFFVDATKWTNKLFPLNPTRFVRKLIEAY